MIDNNKLSNFTRRSLLLAAGGMAMLPALQGCGGGGYSDITIPMPAVLRKDLHFVYYLSVPGQTAKVKDHTSLIWHAQFYSNAELEIEASGNDLNLVLDCATQLFNKGFPAVSSLTAADDLHNYFVDLNNRSLLQRVRYLVVMDEPNIFALSEEELLKATRILKAEAAKWECLQGVQYICIYGGRGGNYPGLSEFDIVGIDNYDQKAEVLTKGAHADLMRNITPNQKVLVIPGAAYEQDPAAFVAYAHTEPKCWGVVPFLWAHIPESADKEGWTGLSKQTTENQERYRKAGMLTLNRK